MTEQRLSFMEFESPWIFNPGTVRLPSPPEGLSTYEVRQRLMNGELPRSLNSGDFVSTLPLFYSGKPTERHEPR